MAINILDEAESPERRFDPLFQAQYVAIYRYCLRRLGPIDAEDATADVFAVVWRRIDELPSGDAARAWLFGIAYRVVGNQYRSRLRRHRLATKLGAAADMPSRPLEFEEFDPLYRAFDRLSMPDREVLRLSAWEGLNRGEIASVLGISENAVDQRLHRARARLKVRLGEPNVETSQETT